MLELEEEPFQKAIFFDVGSPGSMNQSNSNSQKYHIVSPTEEKILRQFRPIQYETRLMTDCILNSFK